MGAVVLVHIRLGIFPVFGLWFLVPDIWCISCIWALFVFKELYFWFLIIGVLPAFGLCLCYWKQWSWFLIFGVFPVFGIYLCLWKPCIWFLIFGVHISCIWALFVFEEAIFLVPDIWCI